MYFSNLDELNLPQCLHFPDSAQNCQNHISLLIFFHVARLAERSDFYLGNEGQNTIQLARMAMNQRREQEDEHNAELKFKRS